MTQAGEVAADRRVSGRGGLEMPALGLGTFRMGENRARRREEVEALKLGLDLGMSLIDTAEMYGHGGAEEVVAEAVRDRREDVFLVTKVLPQNASRKGTVRAAEASLKRLSTEWIDLYLLHWEGRHPIEETLEAFGELREAGKIRHFGVSNLTVRALEAAERHPLGREIAANQIKYHLGQRGIERDLLSWCEKSAVAIMAYSPPKLAPCLRSEPFPSVPKVGLRRTAGYPESLDGLTGNKPSR